MNKYCTENYGPDNKLPLSQLRFENGLSDINKNSDGSIFNRIKSYCQTRSICSTFSSLSSHGDNNLYSETNLINNIRDEVNIIHIQNFMYIVDSIFLAYVFGVVCNKN